jgi:hypothetical protein
VADRVSERDHGRQMRRVQVAAERTRPQGSDTGRAIVTLAPKWSYPDHFATCVETQNAHGRALIHEADPQIQEEWKWAKANSDGTPVWAHDGIVCTGESYKKVVKLTFARGASLADPQKLFNSSLEGSTRRAIDIREGEKLNDDALKALIRSAVAANSEALARRAAQKK